MRILVFRHGPYEQLGWIADALAARGMAYDCLDLYQSSASEPLISDANALIFLGGAQSANDDLPYIRREIANIQQAVARGTPVLGVCLGSQLIAKALGAKVSANRVKEIGWAPVTFNDAVRLDPLFAGLSGSEVLFHWHGETFALPNGAELLASSSACHNQAFRWGAGVYGLQFHLEVTPVMIAQWCEEDARCGEQCEAAAPIDPHAHAARAEELARLVFGRWCDLVSRTAIPACP